MWRVKFTEMTLAPNVKLAIRRHSRWEISSPDFDHFQKGKHLDIRWQRRSSLRRWICAQLTFSVVAHRIDVTILCQNERMGKSASNFWNFIRNPLHVKRSQLLVVVAQSQLTVLVLPAHKKSSYWVDKSCVIATCGDLSDLGLVVLVEVNWLGSEYLAYFLPFGHPTLAKVIGAPSKNITLPCAHDCMVGTAWNIL